MKTKGFTLIELVIVIAILAILAAVAIPRFVDLSRHARHATAEAELGALRAAANLYYASTAVNEPAPYFPGDRTLLRAQLASPVTQLEPTGSFDWSYNSTTGVVSEGSFEGWTW